MGISMGLIIVVGILLLGALLVIWGIGVYNRLIKERELVRNAMGQIAAQIESRWDALKSLIEATRQYAGHEADTFKSVTEARSQVTSRSTVADVEQDNQLFDRAMANINAVAEAYPDLKASAVYQQSMGAVDKYENQVRQSRMVYNDTVTKYNRTIQQVPSNIIAGLFNFSQERYFENSADKAEVPSWNA